MSSSGRRREKGSKRERRERIHRKVGGGGVKKRGKRVWGHDMRGAPAGRYCT